jgi:hypothetical protein
MASLEVAEREIIRKALLIFKKELSLEEYARFLMAITPKVGDSAKELRNFGMLTLKRSFKKNEKERGGAYDCDYRPGCWDTPRGLFSLWVWHQG